MHAITRSHPAQAGGFTLLEALVAVTILSILLAIGVPSMSHWLMSTKAASASELYAEGLRMARQQALGHNAQSRLVFSNNALNGQKDWQVDICFPAAGVICDEVNGAWSTISAASSSDPEGATGTKSVFGSANVLPTTEVLTTTLAPAASNGVYFNSRGWVDSSIANNLTQITLTPTAAYANDIRTTALRVTLAGTVIKCEPNVVSTDSRACQP